ncbi:MAG: hypothetical protein U0802_02860 [Candidatus Binatia bacterium]
MKVLLSWLRELVPVSLDTAALVERLSLGGLVVDAVETLGAEIRDVVVAEILSTAPHPNAERLTLCTVRTGAGPTATVVCGARNMKAGDRVAYAPPGSSLPGGRRIEHAEVRGVASAGMLCSEAELGIGPGRRRVSWCCAEVLPMRLGAHLDIEDTLLDIDVTPNRGDCLSVLGIARGRGAHRPDHAAHPQCRAREGRAGDRGQGADRRPACACATRRVSSAASRCARRRRGWSAAWRPSACAPSTTSSM